MGQYYVAVFTNEKKDKVLHSLDPYHYGCNGCKLMEHSYLRNDFVAAVVNFLVKNGGGNLVWAGDYADEVPGREYNLYSYACEGEGEQVKGESMEIPDVRFFLNEDKKEFIDLWGMRSVGNPIIHPLPLLCVDGNGRGGGDYEGVGMDFVGSWAGDFITARMSNEGIPEGYKEIRPNFNELHEISYTLGQIKEVLKQADQEGCFKDSDFYSGRIIEQTEEILKLLKPKKN